MKREYFVLFTCDEWKGYSSMRLVGVFNLTKLRKVVKKMIKSDDFSCDGYDIKDIDVLGGSDINNMITYGFIQPIGLNEEQ